MKKCLAMILVFCLIFLFTACKDEIKNESLPQTDQTQINIKIGQNLFSATLENNDTAEALKQKFPLTLTMSELNGNEKYHYLSEDLPSNPKRINTIHTGDLMLYGTNCIVLFYETFSTTYSYTKIGSIIEASGLKEALGSGDVTITFSITSTQDSIDPEKPNDKEQSSEASFVYQKEGNSYTITDYTGKEMNVVIPREHDGLPVTKIQGEYGTGAFARQEFISITIPDSITEIVQNTFHNCSKLETIQINEHSNLVKIGNNAFSGNSSLKSIYIPKGMVELGEDVFNNCGALERLIVADANPFYRSENNHLIDRATQTLIRGSNNSAILSGVKRIAKAAFRRVETITELTIPQTVEYIGNYFIADSSITKINYLGTEEEWATIVKDSLWNYGKEDVQLVFKTEEEKEITTMYLYINENKLEVELEKNAAVTALIELLNEGDISYMADDYGGFEKVGSLGHTLPTENSEITTEAGDVILYSGNQIVLFYGSNTWSYTRLGKIKECSASELSTILSAGNGSIQVRISLR